MVFAFEMRTLRTLSHNEFIDDMKIQLAVKYFTLLICLFCCLSAVAAQPFVNL